MRGTEFMEQVLAVFHNFFSFMAIDINTLLVADRLEAQTVEPTYSRSQRDFSGEKWREMTGNQELTIMQSQKLYAVMFGRPFTKAFALTHSAAVWFRCSSLYTECLSYFPCLRGVSVPSFSKKSFLYFHTDFSLNPTMDPIPQLLLPLHSSSAGS